MALSPTSSRDTGIPSGPAGGGLAGTFPNPSLAGGGFLAQPASLLTQFGTVMVATSGTPTAMTANHTRGFRFVIPKTGNLRDVTVYITASSGNVCASVLDTTVTTRQRLATSGSVASPGTGWQTIFDPNLAVTVGDHVDICIGADNNTVTFGRSAGANLAAMAQLPTAFLVSPLGGLPIVAWDAATFPLGTSIAEASLVPVGNFLAVIARIS